MTTTVMGNNKQPATNYRDKTGEPPLKRLCSTDIASERSTVSLAYQDDWVSDWLSDDDELSRDAWHSLQSCFSAGPVIDVSPAVTAFIVKKVCEGLKCGTTKKFQVVYNFAEKILHSNLFRCSFKKCIQNYLDLLVAILNVTEDYNAFVKTVISVKDFCICLVECNSEFVEGFVKCAFLPLLKSYSNVKSTLLAKDKVTGLRETLVTILQQILFPKQECSKRKQYLNLLFSGNGDNVVCDHHSSLPMVFSVLCGALETLQDTLCISGFCMVLQCFISSHDGDTSVVLKFLAVCFHLVGFTYEVSCEAANDELGLGQLDTGKLSKPRKVRGISYAVVDGIVKTLTNINFVADNEHGACLMNILGMLCMTATQKSKKRKVYTEYLDMCSSVIYYNPVAMAPKIFNFLVPVMLFKKCDNPELSISYVGLLHCVLEVFVKLSRLQKLFTKILPLIRDAVVQSGTDIDVNEVLPKAFCKELCMTVMQLPSQQILGIMRSFCYHLQQDCLTPLDQGNPGGVAALYVQVLTRLTCTFLRGVKVACHSVPRLFVTKFLSHLVELHETLGRYADAMLTCQSDEPLLVGLLEMCHSIGELQLVLANYRPSVWKLNAAPSNASMYNMAALHPYITSDKWSIIVERTNTSDHNAAKEILSDLLLQKMVALQLFGNTGERHVQQEIARHFAALPSVHVTKLLPNLPLLVQFLDKQELLILTRNMLKVVECSQEVHAAMLAILQHEVICEDRIITETFVWVTVEQISRIIAQCVSEKYSQYLVQSQEVLSTTFVNMSSHSELHSDVLSPVLTNIGYLVTLACKGDVFLSDSTECTDMKMLEWHVHILKTLPLSCVSVDIQTLVALITISLVACLQTTDPKNTLIKSLCEDILLGVVENAKQLNLSAYVHFDVFLGWLFAVGADLDKQRLVLLFRKLFDSYWRHQGKLAGLKPLVDNITAMRSCDELVLATASTLLASLRQYGKKLFCKKKKSIRKIILSPLSEILAKAEHCGQDSARLEVFANILMLELAMSKLLVTKCYLAKFFNIALAGLNSENDNLVDNSLLFIKLLLQNLEKLGSLLPQDFVSQVWTTSCIHSSEQHGRLLMKAASEEEFEVIINSLLHKTKERLACRSAIGVLMTWWTCVVSCPLSSGKCTVRQTAVECLCVYLLAALDHCQEQAVEILKMEEALISNPQVRMVPHVMDLCLQSVWTLSATGEVLSFQAWPVALSVLHLLHTHRSAWLWDRLPSLSQGYTQLAASLARLSDVGRHLVSAAQVEHLTTFALGLTKFTNSLVSSNQHLKRLCPYLIADILHEIESHNIHSSVKVHFQNCINYLLSVSDANTVAYLLRVLEPADAELFKSVYGNYKKYFKFVGKI